MSLVFRNNGVETMRIDSSGQIGIGSLGIGNSIERYNQWVEIEKLAETNPAVKIALEKLITVYKLSKDYNE